MERGFIKGVVGVAVSTFVLFPGIALAQVAINEVMYDPLGADSAHGGEWIELYMEEGVGDLTVWKVADRDGVKGKFINKSITHISGSKAVASGAYVVLASDPAAFRAFYPSYGGSLFQSNFSLTGDDEVKLLDSKSNTIDGVIYSKAIGGNGDGASIQKISGERKVSAPTPGASNVLSAPKALSYNPSISWAQSATSGSVAPLGGSANTKLEVTPGGDRLTSPGSPISFEASVKKNAIPNVKISYSWSFGDGYVGAGPLVTHIYKYPGEYLVVLNAKAGDAFAVSRSKVRVVAPQISIVVGDGYLELFNNSDAEVNLFNWKIVHGGKGFIFQPDTIILPKSSIKVDLALFSMRGEREGETVLTNSLGQRAASLPPRI